MNPLSIISVKPDTTTPIHRLLSTVALLTMLVALSGCEPWIKPYWEPASSTRNSVSQPDLTPDPDGNHYVVLRKTRQQSKARDYIRELKAAGFPAEYHEQADQSYLVTVGPYRSREVSDKVRQYALSQGLTVSKAYVTGRNDLENPPSSGSGVNIASIGGNSSSGGSRASDPTPLRGVSRTGSGSSGSGSGTSNQTSARSVSSNGIRTVYNNYYVAARIMTDEQMAIAKARELRKLGYDTGVYWTHDGDYVVTLCFCSLNEANRLKDSAVSKGHATRGAWVTQGQEFIENIYPNGMQ